MSDLGTLNGQDGWANGINDQGVAVGVSISTGFRALLWSGNSVVDLAPDFPSSIAFDINNSGDVVGQIDDPQGMSHAVLWRQGQIILLGGLPFVWSRARAINDAGQIVGQGIDITGQHRAFLWQNGVMTGLTPNTVYAVALDINERGQITGEYSEEIWSVTIPFLWENGVLTDLVDPTCSDGGVGGINEAGIVAGRCQTSGAALLRPAQASVPISDPSSVAIAINDNNQVVGQSGNHAMLWSVSLNRPPIASINVPATVVENAPFSVVSLSSDPDGNTLTYDWSMGDGAPNLALSQFNYHYVDNGPREVTLTVSDGALTNTATTTILVTNADPVIQLPNAALNGVAGVRIPFAYSFSDEGTLDQPWAVGIDWGDGSSTHTTKSAQGGSSEDHTFANAGSYAVHFTVTDKDGGVGTASVLVTVTAANRPPLPHPGGPYRATEGATVSFNGTASSDPDGNVLTYDWDFGDGSTHGTGPTPSHIYGDNGTYHVVLRVSDGQESRNGLAIVPIDNAPPVAQLGASSNTLHVGQPFRPTVIVDDPGFQDGPWQIRLEWGDGTPDATMITSVLGSPTEGLHQYSNTGQFTVAATVTDKDGGSHRVTMNITVTPNTAPVANAGGPYTGTEGAKISFDGSRSSDPDGDAVKFDWDFGDGSPHSNGAKPIHSYADNGSFTVRLTVTDGPSTHTTTARVTVTNVAPVATLNHNLPPIEGKPFAIQLTNPVDPGTTDVTRGFQYAFDCGYGLGFGPFTTQSTQNCLGLDNGARRIRARIRDKDGGVTTMEAQGDIQNVAPEVIIAAPNGLSVRRNERFQMRMTFDDPWLLDLPWKVVIDWGNGTQSYSTPLQFTNLPQFREYRATGTYKIRVTVTDKDGGKGTSNELTLTVRP